MGEKDNSSGRMINKPKVWNSTQESSLMGEIHIEMLNTNSRCAEGTPAALWVGQQCSLCFEVNHLGPENLRGCAAGNVAQLSLDLFCRHRKWEGRKESSGRKEAKEGGREGGKVPDVTGSQCNLLRCHCYRIQET